MICYAYTFDKKSMTYTPIQPDIIAWYTEIVSSSGRPKPIFAFNNMINSNQLRLFFNNLQESVGPSEMAKTRIFILSGTHSSPNGQLAGRAKFFWESDKYYLETRTVTVVDINSQTPAQTWRRYFNQTNAVIILGWCYSAYWNQLHLYRN
jgi:hypothetical protein